MDSHSRKNSANKPPALSLIRVIVDCSLAFLAAFRSRRFFYREDSYYVKVLLLIVQSSIDVFSHSNQERKESHDLHLGIDVWLGSLRMKNMMESSILVWRFTPQVWTAANLVD